ncbi:MAG TPA: carbon-nitrogen hydrolase family protein [Gemmataceae bacterium]|jgi:predicted amidohydrolase|nr:carbon-nitrogen hydrolase family protein [Gemmataceae bacterium]
MLWKIAAVQMDCVLGDVTANRECIERNLRQASRQQARLAIFPECALTGYAFDSKEEAWPFAETVPGPSTDCLSGVCRELNVWAAVGMLERDGEAMYNACTLIGPNGLAANYRKIHLPFLGVDRFTAPGNRPFAVHDIGGLRVGLSICYDGSFPETTRVLMLLGADLVVLPTNWPTAAESTVKHLVQSRALENHLYYAAANRIGSERRTRYLGQSRIVNVNGELLASAGPDEETILFAEIDPAVARNKQIVRIPGKYQLNRLADRRPEMYGPITKTNEPEA